MTVLDAAVRPEQGAQGEHGSVVVDTSAAVAILLGEEGSEALAMQLHWADERLMTAPTLVELTIVMEARLGTAGASVVDRFLRDAEIEVVTFTRSLVDRSLEGWRHFGKGRHPAALNYGDCFTYALALDSGLPVLCVGQDFTQTDVRTISPSGDPKI